MTLKSLLIIGVVTLQSPWAATANTSDQVWGSTENALQGAGRAYVQKSSGFWGNPASIWEDHSNHIETGISSYKETVGGVASWVGNAGPNSALGLQWLQSNQNKLNHRYYKVNVSTNTAERAQLGIQATVQSIPNNLNMDLSGGFIYRGRQDFFLGGDLKNLAKSLVKTDPIQNPGRSWGLGMAWLPLGSHIWAVGYDFSGNNPKKWSEYDHTVYQSLSLGKLENFNLFFSTKSYSLFKKSQFTQGIGIRLQEKFFNSLIQLSYSAGGIPLANSESNIKHMLSLGFHLDPFKDHTPPLVTARIDKGLLLTDFRTDKEASVNFQLQLIEDSRKIRSWHLLIYKADTDLKPEKFVISFSGKEPLPRSISWDGRDRGNYLVEPGIYTFRFIATDASNNLSQTNWQIFEIK